MMQTEYPASAIEKYAILLNIWSSISCNYIIRTKLFVFDTVYDSIRYKWSTGCTFGSRSLPHRIKQCRL